MGLGFRVLFRGFRVEGCCFHLYSGVVWWRVRRRALVARVAWVPWSPGMDSPEFWGASFTPPPPPPEVPETLNPKP